MSLNITSTHVNTYRDADSIPPWAVSSSTWHCNKVQSFWHWSGKQKAEESVSPISKRGELVTRNMEKVEVLQRVLCPSLYWLSGFLFLSSPWSSTLDLEERGHLHCKHRAGSRPLDEIEKSQAYGAWWHPRIIRNLADVARWLSIIGKAMAVTWLQERGKRHSWEKGRSRELQSRKVQLCAYPPAEGHSCPAWCHLQHDWGCPKTPCPDH